MFRSGQSFRRVEDLFIHFLAKFSGELDVARRRVAGRRQRQAMWSVFCSSGSRFSSWRGDKTPITMRNMTAFFILLRTINQLMWGPSVRSEVEVATDSSFG